ncbi:vitellogenin-2-like isoform X4 [Odontesthes bonariensis]|uniref:vitellogenin-2-like isoform X4 n=1 Tax=Odontesthes bonariensis TaxID=219752 RepID=UPI003F5852BE
MRALVLALIVALVAGNQVNFAPEFDSGKTYKYKYEAHLLGGLPEEGLARAGVKIQSKVLIGAEAPSTIALKLIDPAIYEYSGNWPEDVFVPATKLTSALSAQLLTPIKFEYANGVVGKVFAPIGVSETVLNIHRGILNVLQLSIKKTQNVYEVQEPGIHGVCKTHYVVSEDFKAERIHLTKTKDLNHCQERIFKDIGLTGYTERCAECEARGKTMRRAVAINYVMKPSTSGALILEAMATELTQYSPFNILNGAAQMEAKQILTFLDIKKIPVEPIKADFLHRGYLKYEFGKELLQTPVQLLRISNTEAQIVETLNRLVTLNVGKAQEDSPLKFIELIQLLRVARYESIEALWSQFKAKNDYRHWMLSSIPAIGTHVALKFIKEKLIAGDLTNAEGAQALLSSVHLVTADLEAIKLLEGLAMTPKIKDNPVLHELSMLGFGSMVSKYCSENPSCPSELLRPVHELLIQALLRHDNDKLTMALKVLGNAGHPSSLKPIMRLLPGFGSAATILPHRLHIDAALALRKIAKREPRFIQEVAVQLFMNKNLHPELRMVAAIVLFETKLPMGLVTTLAKSLLRESNLQVASFVYSYMKALAKTTSPDHSSVAAACNVAIRILSPKLDRLSYRFSRAFYYDAYHNPWMVGAAASVYYINDAATVLPRAIMAKARAYVAGVYVDVLEFGVRTEGLQEALLKIPDVSAHADRLTKVKQAIKALSEWKTSPSSQPLASAYVKVLGQEIAFANIDKTIVEQIIQFVNRSETRTYGKKALAALLSGYTLHYSKPMLAAEIRRIFPTSVGLPMELSLYTAAVAAASVEVQASVSPPLPDNFSPAQLLKSDISVRAAIAPSVSMHTYAVMGVNTAFIQAAVVSRAKVHTVVPVKMAARFDMIKGYFNFQFLPVQGVNTIASAFVDTYAVARNVEDIAAAKIKPIIPAGPVTLPLRHNFISQSSRMAYFTESRMATSSEILPIDLPRRIITKLKIPKVFVKKMCAASQIFGIKLCAEIQSRNALFLRNSIVYTIVGNHAVSLRVSPAAGPVVERIEIEVQVGEKAAEKIIKVVNMSEEEEILEDKNVLMKLKKILVPRLKNSTVVSSSSSSSRSTSSQSSSSRSSSSSSASSKSSSGSTSRSMSNMVDLLDPIIKMSRRSSSNSSSSSTSSSSSSSMSKQELYEMNFTKNHIHQHSISAEHVNSNSSAQSFESIYNKAKYLSNSVSPAVTILIRAVRADHKNQGYQIAAYYEKENARVQVIFAKLTENDNWRICADAMMLCNHKLMARIAWGIECKQHNSTIIAETGLVGKNPAVRVKMTWGRLSDSTKRYVERISEHLSRITVENGVSRTKVKNAPKQIQLTVAVASETSMNVLVKSPKSTIYKLGMGLPVSLPVGDTAAELEAYPDNWTEKMSYMLTKAHAAECTMFKDTLITFNKRKYKTEMPHSCYQVLAQDCTSELKFMVLLKRDQPQEENMINVKIENIDFDMYPKNSAIMVKVNGVEIPVSNLPYQHPAGNIQIRQRGEGISLHAPVYGLQEVFLSFSALKVKVVDWMRGQTCGLCGKADGEVKQEYSTPNERVTKNATSFAHSWVLSGQSCRDTAECYVKLESVKLEKKVTLQGEESKCYSVEPVLRCLPGCMPVRTTPVTVGYHCLPIDSNLNRSDILSSISEKSIDLRETAEAHLACHCTAQCA